MNELVSIAVAVGVPTIAWALALAGSVRAVKTRLYRVEQKLGHLSELIEERQARVRAGDSRVSGSHRMVE